MHERIFVCGTRAVVQVGPSDYRVVCATCDGGGTVSYHVKGEATARAVKDSGRPCQCRGCNAR